MVANSDRARSMLLERDYYLGRCEGWIRGYRTDAHRMITQLLSDVALQPVILRVLESAYKALEENGQKEESQRDKTITPLYLKIQEKIVTYVKLKRAQLTSLEKFAETDAWTKEIIKATDQKKIEALLKASDHIEDTVFLTELASSCFLPPSMSHVSEEIDGLTRKLSENYFSLLSSKDAGVLREKLAPALQEASQFYSKREFDQVLKKIEDVSMLLHPKNHAHL